MSLRVPNGAKDVTPLGDPAKVGGGPGNVGTPIPKKGENETVMSEPEPKEREPEEEKLNDMSEPEPEEPEEEKLNDLCVPNGAKDVATPLGDPAKVGGSSGNVGTTVSKYEVSKNEEENNMFNLMKNIAKLLKNGD